MSDVKSHISSAYLMMAVGGGEYESGNLPTFELRAAGNEIKSIKTSLDAGSDQGVASFVGIESGELYGNKDLEGSDFRSPWLHVDMNSVGIERLAHLQDSKLYLGGLLHYNKIVEAVPEPSTWLLMLIGFAAIGISMQRREIAPSCRSEKL